MHFDDKNTVVSSAKYINLEQPSPLCHSDHAICVDKKKEWTQNRSLWNTTCDTYYLGSVIVHYYIEHIVFDLLDNFETNLMPVREHPKIQACVAGCYGL